MCLVHESLPGNVAVPRNNFQEVFLGPGMAFWKHSGPHKYVPGNVSWSRNVFLEMFLFPETFSRKCYMVQECLPGNVSVPRNISGKCSCFQKHFQEIVSFGMWSRRRGTPKKERNTDFQENGIHFH
jgi:hypothetical protein